MNRFHQNMDYSQLFIRDGSVYHPEEIPDGAPVGAKARVFLSLEEDDFKIPGWFIVLPDAFFETLGEKEKHLQDPDAEIAELSRSKEDLQMSPSLREELESAFDILCPDGCMVAIRTSYRDSEGLPAYLKTESTLFVQRENFAEQVTEVWRNILSTELMYARQEAGLPPVEIPCILVQRMVFAEVSGVAFSADPATGRRRSSVIYAGYGVNCSEEVSEVPVDRFEIHKETGEIVATIEEKILALSSDPHNGPMKNLRPVDPGLVYAQAISNVKIPQVANVARQVQSKFGFPHKIAFAISKGVTYLLDAHPLLALADLPDPEDPHSVWDHEMIAESFPGVTTPLTFSFAQRLATRFRQSFFHALRMPKSRIESKDHETSHHLGMIRGRLFVNVSSLNRGLKRLPGFVSRRDFWEGLTGSRDRLPADHMTNRDPKSADRPVWRDRLEAAHTWASLSFRFRSFEDEVAAFQIRVERALEEPSIPASEMSTADLVKLYLKLEHQCFSNWETPLVNSFYARILYRRLREQTRTYLNDENGALAHALLSNDGKSVTSQAIVRLKDLGRLVAENDHVWDVMRDPSSGRRAHKLRRCYAFHDALKDYLSKYGERGFQELQLESIPPSEDPDALLHAIVQMARKRRRGIEEETNEDFLAAAIQQIEDAKLGFFAKRKLNRTLNQARQALCWREDLRLLRARAFGRVRMIMRELGKRHTNKNRLEEPNDIFYLTLEEILGFSDASSATIDLAAAASTRKKEFESYRKADSLPHQFETFGPPANDSRIAGNQFPEPSLAHADNMEWTGIACCPGVVSGNAKVTSNPRSLVTLPGEILIAEQMDPGWIIHFPGIAAILMENGDAMSHTACLAREMNIPCITGLKGITQWIQTGDQIHIDGSTGIVRKWESS